MTTATQTARHTEGCEFTAAPIRLCDCTAKYGYNPHQGTEQFYDCEPPTDSTAPITFWMRDNAKLHFVDVRMPDNHVIRSIAGETVAIYVARGGVVLPDAKVSA